MALTDDHKRILRLKVHDLVGKLGSGDGQAGGELYDLILLDEADLLTVLQAFRVQLIRHRQNRVSDLEEATNQELAALQLLQG